jgi:hypothetical protein
VSKRATQLACLLPYPTAIELERRYAGESAAAVLAVGAGRPAHHADYGEARWRLLEGGRAGVAGAGAEARSRAAGRGIDQAKLKIAWLASGDERRLAQPPGALAVAANCGAVAVHDETLAGRNARLRRRERRGSHR